LATILRRRGARNPGRGAADGGAAHPAADRTAQRPARGAGTLFATLTTGLKRR